MTQIYKILEKEVEQLELIENWGERVSKMKELKERIALEQDKLNALFNTVLKDETKDQNKKLEKVDLKILVDNFKQASELDDKIKYYQQINMKVNEVEKQLFD